MKIETRTQTCEVVVYNADFENGNDDGHSTGSIDLTLKKDGSEIQNVVTCSKNQYQLAKNFGGVELDNARIRHVSQNCHKASPKTVFFQNLLNSSKSSRKGPKVFPVEITMSAIQSRLAAGNRESNRRNVPKKNQPYPTDKLTALRE
uniref:Uncharacterized protein n=1 Tax=Moniliophthora roreri TaxID=221103 RepID=A0A0W0FYX9_MONRR